MCHAASPGRRWNLSAGRPVIVRELSFLIRTRSRCRRSSRPSLHLVGDEDRCRAGNHRNRVLSNCQLAACQGGSRLGARASPRSDPLSIRSLRARGRGPVCTQIGNRPPFSNQHLAVTFRHGHQRSDARMRQIHPVEAVGKLLRQPDSHLHQKGPPPSGSLVGPEL